MSNAKSSVQNRTPCGPDVSRTCMVSVPAAELHREASVESEVVSQLLHGEHVLVLGREGDWLQVRSMLDGYEGHVQQLHLSEQCFEATHRIVNRATLLFSHDHIKSRVVHTLGFGCLISLAESPMDDSDFLKTRSGHYLWKDHCLPLRQPLTESPIDIVRNHFLATPYRWGGRCSAGLDCSGLVQLVAASIGIPLPRDSKDQEQVLTELPKGETLRANDLVFWPGHVAWVVDPKTLIHANAASLSVREEPLEAVNSRAGPPGSYRRLPLEAV